MTIRVVLGEDNVLVREGVRALLDSSTRPDRFTRPPSTDFEHFDQEAVGWTRRVENGVAAQGDVAHDRVTAGARHVLPGDIVATVLRAHLPRSDEQAAGESHPQGWPFHRWPPCV